MAFSIRASASVVSRLRGSVAVLMSVLLSASGALPTHVDRPFSPALHASSESPMNLDPRSESVNTELGMLAACSELAAEVMRVLDMSEQRSSYRLRLGADGRSLEWVATDADREAVLSQEPEVTPFSAA